ncbi:hypothetical protein [Shewanella sp.]|uniref:hypothetical protein n=1 Tax=Shewanella sp. TaxID=50422 RepID=UPI003F2D5504
MSFAKRMQNVASKLLDKFDESEGRIVLVKKGGEPVWDSELGEMVPAPAIEIPLTGVTVEYSQGMVNGTTIQSGDVLVIAKVVNPIYGGISLQDKVKFDGAQWSIVTTPKADYTGVVICYKIQCRK